MSKGVNCVHCACDRLSYVAGRDGHFPEVLGFISMKRLTPVPAVLWTVRLFFSVYILKKMGRGVSVFVGIRFLLRY